MIQTLDPAELDAFNKKQAESREVSEREVERILFERERSRREEDERTIQSGGQVAYNERTVELDSLLKAEYERIIYEYERKKTYDADKSRKRREELFGQMELEKKGQKSGDKEEHEHFPPELEQKVRAESRSVEAGGEIGAPSEYVSQAGQRPHKDGPSIESRRPDEDAERQEDLRTGQDRALEESMRKRLHQFGFQESQIGAMVNPEEQNRLKKQQSEGLMPHKSLEIAQQPTYAKIRKEHLEVETLHYYDIPYEYDEDPNYIIVLREMSQRETDILFEHTRRLRSNHGERLFVGEDGKNRVGKQAVLHSDSKGAQGSLTAQQNAAEGTMAGIDNERVLLAAAIERPTAEVADMTIKQLRSLHREHGLKLDVLFGRQVPQQHLTKTAQLEQLIRSKEQALIKEHARQPPEVLPFKAPMRTETLPIDSLEEDANDEAPYTRSGVRVVKGTREKIMVCVLGDLYERAALTNRKQTRDSTKET
jgi:hypothetical protein